MAKKYSLVYPAPRVGVGTTRSELVSILRMLGKRLGFVCPEDWYSLEYNDLDIFVGLRARAGNPIRAARTVHPELNPLEFLCRSPSC